MTHQLMTIAQIADETGLTHKGARARLRGAHMQIVARRGRFGLYETSPELLQTHCGNGGYITERTTDRREQVTAMTRQGMTAKQIGEALGIASRNVVRYRVAAGITQPASVRVTDAQWQAAARMLQDGCSLAEIARTIGANPSTVAAHYPGRGWTKQEVGEWRAFMRKANRQLKAIDTKQRPAQHAATEEA